MKMKLPRYNSPLTQIVLVSLVCFGTVGMFSAIGNLGAGGTQNIALSDTTNAVLYTCFAVAGIVSGSVNNVLGSRLTLFIGSLGYALYVGALWAYQTHSVDWFLILSGAILGVCAAMLWSAQGSIMMSYPLEKDKGRAFGIFWVIFNSGSLLGGLIALGINIAQGAIAATATSTYIAFLVVIACGVALTWSILPPGRIVRSDNTLVKVHSYATVREELRSLWPMLKNKTTIFLLPMFFASNYFYSYQGALAFAIFDAQTRAVNGVVKALGQIFGAVAIGLIMDKAPFKRRRNKGLFGIAVTTVIVLVSYAWGVHYQLRFTRATEKSDLEKINYRDSAFGEPIAILILYDIGDAMFQGAAYWIMGALTNDSFVLSRYAGLYKAVQSAGAAVAFGVDAVKTPYLNELLSAWIMLLVALAGAAWVVKDVKDSNYEVEEVVHVGDPVMTEDGQIHVAGEKDLDEKDVEAHQITQIAPVSSGERH